MDRVEGEAVWVTWENGREGAYAYQGERPPGKDGESNARIPWYGDLKDLEVIE